MSVAAASAYLSLREALKKEPEAFGMSAEEHRSTTVAGAAARMGEDTTGTFVIGAFAEAELILWRTSTGAAR